ELRIWPVEPGWSGAVVDILVADDVILAEVVAELHFDHFHIDAAEILQPVTIAEVDVDRLSGGHRPDNLADGHGGLAGDHHPMLPAMIVALQRKAALRPHHQA